MKKNIGTPKLTPPRQARALARPRLFDLLDQAAPAIWVSGPAGAGKTTLLATYVTARSLVPVWYQFDLTDGDPGTLFHHLKESLPAGRHKLPDFVERYRAGAEAFAQRFFRQYFAAITSPDFVLVLDGAERAPSCALLVQAAHEVREGARLILVSRDPPPAEFARLELQGGLTHLSWDHLRFSESETLDLMHLEADRGARSVSRTEGAALHARSGGWAAGLRLLLEQFKRDGQWRADLCLQENGTLFRFIASEVFDGLPAPQQEMLLRLCMLPEVRARDVIPLTGGSPPEDGLEDLDRRRLFVDRLQGMPPVYRIHDLFREFLVQRARSVLPPPEYKVLQRKSGELLAVTGRIEHAIDLLAAAGEWQRASQLILDNAAVMMARGQSVGLRQWLKALPGWYVDAAPRLLYCLGMAQSTVEPDRSMATLDRAHQRFSAQSNAQGQALCAAGLIQAYYFRCDSYLGMERWGHHLAILFAEGLEPPTPEMELHLRSLLQVALTYRDPGHAVLAPCARRILALLSRDIEVNQRVVAGALFLPYCDWLEPDLAPLVIGVMQPLMKSRDLTAFNRLWWMSTCAHHCICGNAPHELNDVAMEVEALATRDGTRLSAALTVNLALMRMIAGLEPLSGVHDLLKQIPRPDPLRRQEELNSALYSVELHLQAGDPDSALRNAERGVQLCRDLGVVIAHSEALGLLALTRVLRKDFPAARAAFEEARSLVKDFRSPRLEYEHLLLGTFLDMAEGRAQPAQESLRDALRHAAQHGLGMGHIWMPEYMARLCAFALDSGIEIPQARHIIRSRRLAPPPAHESETWPWLIRIRVLGAGEILVEDVVLRMEGKAQKKPLELLRALIARGPGGAELGLLADDLWPDSDGDAADNNMRMTLHRLRKLLRHSQAVVVEESRVRLNETCVWVDAWALDKCYLRQEGKSGSTVEDAQAMLARITGLYRGEAFMHAPEEPWILAARDRWRVRYERLVTRLRGQTPKLNAA